MAEMESVESFLVLTRNRLRGGEAGVVAQIRQEEAKLLQTQTRGTNKQKIVMTPENYPNGEWRGNEAEIETDTQGNR